MPEITIILPIKFSIELPYQQADETGKPAIFTPGWHETEIIRLCSYGHYAEVK
jgi:hypothetical protein